MSSATGLTSSDSRSPGQCAASQAIPWTYSTICWPSSASTQRLHTVPPAALAAAPSGAERRGEEPGMARSGPGGAAGGGRAPTPCGGQAVIGGDREGAEAAAPVCPVPRGAALCPGCPSRGCGRGDEAQPRVRAAASPLTCSSRVLPDLLQPRPPRCALSLGQCGTTAHPAGKICSSFTSAGGTGALPREPRAAPGPLCTRAAPR